MAPSSDEIVTSLEEPDECPEPEHETQRPSILSTLPVALVVEQTARILEDIKKKIQEEKRLKLEQQNRSESPSPSYSELSRPSFVILNHRHSTSSAILNNISPLNQTSFPRSLSPDSGTDYEPFSASSSISPPFLSKLKRTNAGSTSDVMKLSHNSDDDIFKPVSSFSPLIQTNLTSISPTTSLNSIHTPARRLSGVAISHLTTTSLAKSTPSISTNLINESHQKPEQTSFSNVSQSPFSFQVLQSNFEFDTKYFDTYHDPKKAQDPLVDRYRSLANLPNNNLMAQLTSSSCIASSPFISFLQNNNRFGTPSSIKPIASAALDGPNNKFKLAGITMSPSATLCFKDNFSKSFDYARSYSSAKRNILEEEHQKQIKPDFLSLSLSPPMNRKRGGFVEIKGSL